MPFFNGGIAIASIDGGASCTLRQKYRAMNWHKVSELVGPTDWQQASFDADHEAMTPTREARQRSHDRFSLCRPVYEALFMDVRITHHDDAFIDPSRRVGWPSIIDTCDFILAQIVSRANRRCWASRSHVASYAHSLCARPEIASRLHHARNRRTPRFASAAKSVSADFYRSTTVRAGDCSEIEANDRHRMKHC